MLVESFTFLNVIICNVLQSELLWILEKIFLSDIVQEFVDQKCFISAKWRYRTYGQVYKRKKPYFLPPYWENMQ